MKKLIISASIMAVVSVPTVNASIALDDAGKVSMFGDFRLRIERDDRDRVAPTPNQERERLRYRARLGVKFKPADNWAGTIRFATSSGNDNSPHETFDTNETADMDLDQAYLAYSKDNLTLHAGRTPLNYWQSSEMFWDQDINPDALAAVYKMGDITLNAAYAIVNDNGWNNDDTLTMFQAVYGKDKLKAALAWFNVNSHNAFVGETFTTLTAQYKEKDWRAVIELASSDANAEELAYVAQFRKSLGGGHGLRLYYYHVEAFSVPGDGAFAQDDFPDPNGTGVSNFEGFRLQYDYKIDKNVAMDVRFYQMEAADDAVTALSAAPNGISTETEGRNRLQVNINLKF